MTKYDEIWSLYYLLFCIIKKNQNVLQFLSHYESVIYFFVMLNRELVIHFSLIEIVIEPN